MSKDKFRALEDISGHRSPPKTNAGTNKADDLLVAAITAYASITRPGRYEQQQFEDLVVPLLDCATSAGKRRAAHALAQLPEAPRKLILALANEQAEVSGPLLLRSPLLSTSDLIDLIATHGIAHARVIARRQSGDALLLDVLRSFDDPIIERTLSLQESLADVVAEPLETSSNSVGEDESSESYTQTQASPFTEYLIDSALLSQNRLFRNALADILGISHERTDTVIGDWLNSRLPIALAAVGLSASDCFLIMSALLGPVEASREHLRAFVDLYRSIDEDKALALTRRWKAEDMSRMLRNKLKEMASSDNSLLTNIANSDSPSTFKAGKR